MQHSWGEFYETLLEMKKNGDDPQDPLFDRAYILFSALDDAKTEKEIRDLIHANVPPIGTFTELEINRLNSKCFDGLLAADEALLQDKGCSICHALVLMESSFPETYKYILSKLENEAIFTYDKPKFIYEYRFGGKPEYLEIFRSYYPVEKYSDISLAFIFSKACEYDDISLVKYFIEKDLISQIPKTEIYFSLSLTCENDFVELTSVLLQNMKCSSEIIYDHLWQSIKYGQHDMAALLAQNYDKTIGPAFIAYCILHDSTDAVVELIQKEAQEVPKTIDGINIINWSIEKCGDLKIVKALLEKGIPPDAETQSIADQYFIGDAVRELLQKNNSKINGSQL